MPPSSPVESRSLPSLPSPPEPDLLTRLRALPLAASLPEEELGGLAASGEVRRLPRGRHLIREGDPATGFFLLLEGEVEVIHRGGGPASTLAVQHPGDFVGELSLLEGVPAMADVRATRDSLVLALAPPRFHALVAESPGLALAILRGVVERLRSTEASLLQRAKLASLGTLAAGMAHQLNNPAAVVRRGALQLRDALDRWELRSAALGAALGPPAEADLTALQSLLQTAGRRPTPQTEGAPGGLPRLEVEREMESWLLERGVEDAAPLAGELADGGWTPERLSALGDAPGGGPAEPARLRWLAARQEVEGTLEALRQAADVVSGLVEAVRSHAGTGEDAPGTVDLEASVREALGLLESRIGPGIRVEWELPPHPVRAEGRRGELGHVWTNLVENALEAMGPQGTLGIRIHRAGEAAWVEVRDTGPGIPDGLRTRIFDPFFTTRARSGGSGLGLHIARRIVEDRHGGRIAVESGPGGSAFRVCLPVGS